VGTVALHLPPQKWRNLISQAPTENGTRHSLAQREGERDVRAGSHQGQEAGVWEISKRHCSHSQGKPSMYARLQHALIPRPSEEMVKMVLSRPCHPDDQFTTSILRHWCMKHDELLAEHIKALLIKNNSLPRKRQRWAAVAAARGCWLASPTEDWFVGDV
jgi:hypothetical protein